MDSPEPHDNTSIRVMNLVSLIIGLATGLYMVLIAHNGAFGGIAMAVHGLLGLVGGYLGTWLLLILAYLVFWLATGVALGLFIFLSLLCFISVIVAVLG